MGLFWASLRGVVTLLAFCALQLIVGATPARAQTFVCTVTAADYSVLSVANTGAGQSIFILNSDGIYNWSNTNGSAGATCANNPAGADFGEGGEQLRVWNGAVYAPGAVSPGTDFTTAQGGTIRATRVTSAPFDTIAYTPPSPSFTGTDTFYLTDGDINGLRMVITVAAPPTPTVTSISPAAGAAGTTTPNVVITGTGLLGATAVTFGGTTASFVVDSATQITATAPSRSAGAVNVVVTRGSASATSAATVFTYFNAPTITAAFSPTAITTAETSTLTLTLNNPNAGQALTGVAVAAAALPTNLAGSGVATNCGGTPTYNAGTRALSLSGAALAASASCTVTLGISSSAAASYNYTSGAVSATGPGPATGSTATTPTALTVTALPSISIAVSPAGVSEDGATNLTYTVTRSAASTSPLTVDLATTGTATSGSDYTGAAATATILANDTTATVVIDPTVDAAIEADETVIVTITAGTGYTVGAPSAATGTIQNDDVADTTPPAAPVITAPANGARTSDATPDISGTAEPASSVEVQVDSVAVGTVTADVGGAWSLTASALADGPRVIRARATDASLNTGVFSATVTMTVDTAAPAAPVITAPVTGTRTNDTTPTFTGTAEANATVRVFIGGAFSGLGNLTGTNWTYTPTALAEGDYSFWATATDLAGNLGPQSTTGALTIDTTAPAAPVIASPTEGQATTTTPSFTGSAEPGSTVTLTIDATPFVVVADGGGAWSYVSAALAFGAHTATATARDAANNTGPASATRNFTAALPSVSIVVSPAGVSEDGATNLTYTVTRSAASASPLTVDLATTGTATSGSDYTGAAATATIAANDTTATVVIDPTGDALAEADETVIVTVTAGTGYTVGAPSSATGTIQNDDSLPSLSINDVTLTEGNSGTSTATFTVSLSAASGQTVTVNYATADGTALAPGDYVAASGTLTFNPGDTTRPVSVTVNGDTTVETDEGFTVGLGGASNASISDNSGAGSITNDDAPDTTPPPAPVITTPANGSVTADPTPDISGTAEAASVVEILVDAVSIGTATASGAGAWTLTAPVLADGPRAITARATDASLNTGPASATTTVTIDTAPPAAPVVTAPVPGSSIASSTPTISGTAEAGSTVTVLIDGGSIGTVVANGSSAWTLTAPTLADGARTASARATDPAGNTGATSTPVAFTVDATPPPAPVIVTPANGSTTADSTPDISGTAEPLSTVAIEIDSVAVGSVAANGAGAWTLTAPTLSDGPRAIVARAIDAASNTSPASVTATFTVDTAAPAAPVIIAPVSGSAIASSTPTISGTAEVGSTVTVLIDGASIGTVVADGSGAWSRVAPTLADGARTVSARATDTAGATGATSTPIAFTVDTAAPPAPVIVSPANGGDTTAMPTISGTAEAGATVLVTLDGGITSVTANGSGAWNFTPGTISLAPHAVSAQARDAAGNTSAASATTTFTARASSVSGLANLGLSAGALSPAFSTGGLGYTASVGFGITAVTVTLAAVDSASVVRVNGAVVASGAASGAISLAVGTTTIAVVVTAEDGVATTSYSLQVTRAQSDVSTLSGLTLSAGALSPGFGAGTTGYSATVANAISAVTVTPTATDGAATITVNGVSVASGGTSGSITLAVGANTVSTVVTAPDGVSTTTYAITVAREDDAPIAGPVSLSLAYNAPATAVPLALSGGPTTSIAVGSPPANGAVVVSGATATYQPAAGFSGTDSFTYVATGPGGVSAPAPVSVTVAAPINTAPIAVASSLTVAYDAAATPAPLALSGGTVTSLFVTTAPTLGTATVEGGATITYRPTPGAYGVDSFVYTATGPGGVSAPATVTVTITPPTLVLGPASLPNGQEDVAYSATLAVSGGTGPYALTVTGGALPAGLTLSGAGVLSGTPTASGTYGFTVTATDASTGAGPARISQTFALSITTPPPPVIRQPPGEIPNVPGQPTRIDLSALIAGDFDEIRIAEPPRHGTITLEVGGASTASSTGPLAAASLNPRTIAVYSAASGYVGADSFSFVAIGPGGTSTPVRLSITVAGLAPTAANLTASAEQGRPVTVDLTGAASQAPFTSAAIVSITPAGSAGAVLVEGGVPSARAYGLTITPRSDFEGTVVVRYTISNSSGASPPATVTVTVRPRPDPSSDPTVRALATAQAQASRLFATTQLGNFNRRNEGLRTPGEGRGQGLGLSLSSGFAGLNADPLDTLPWADRERRLEAERDLSLVTTAGRSDPFRGGDGRSGAVQAFEGNASTPSGDAGPRAIGSVSVWSGGAITVGGFDQTRRTASFDITTSGVSAGADVKLGDRLTIGAGGGFGTQRTDIGEDDDARLDGESWTGALYGSWRPSSQTFIDGVVGYGELDFDTRRLTPDGGVAFGERNGDALMASLTGGWQRSGPRSTLSAYGRFDHVSVDLEAYSETGAGLYSLAFAERKLDSLVGALGLRGHRTSLLRDGVLTQSGRMEWRHEFSDLDGQGLDYADLSGFRYGVNGETWMRNEVAAELGLEITYDSGLTLGADIGASFAEGGETATLRLLLAKRF